MMANQPLSESELPPVPFDGCRIVSLPSKDGRWWIDIGPLCEDNQSPMFGPNDADLLRAIADWLEQANGGPQVNCGKLGLAVEGENGGKD